MKPKVLLITMPWAMVQEPSLGISILKSHCREAHIDCKTLNLNIYLLHFISFETYTKLADVHGINDFLFSSVLDDELDDKQLLSLQNTASLLLKGDVYWKKRFETPEEIVDFLIDIRSRVIPLYLDLCLQKILVETPTMVGFTCLFDQTFPSLALAKRLKENIASVFVVFGGYSIENETGRELIERFDFIDAISNGAGEDKIVQLARVSVKQYKLQDIPGLCFRDHGIREIPDMPGNINESQCPDFSDYFTNLAELEKECQVQIHSRVLPYEASRGCWWGQKNHCVFCGIDDHTMKYKIKSWEKVYNDILRLTQKYNVSTIRLVDYILSLEYFNNLIPELKNKGIKLTCETKANLKIDQLNSLKEAGFKEVQPGIESFSTSILRKMKKGTNLLQNVFFIKNCYNLDLIVHYNLIFDFPWEDEEDYYSLLRTIPLLYHLPPPNSVVPVAITRHAPLSNEFALSLTGEKQHHYQYDAVFSDQYLAKTGFKLTNYAYYFQKNYSRVSKIQKLQLLLLRQMDNWKNVFHNSSSTLFYETDGDDISFTDSRFGKLKKTVFGLHHRQIYTVINDIITDYSTILETVRLPDNIIFATLTDLIENRLIIQEGNKYLGLATTKMENPVYEQLKEVTLRYSK